MATTCGKSGSKRAAQGALRGDKPSMSEILVPKPPAVHRVTRRLMGSAPTYLHGWTLLASLPRGKKRRDAAGIHADQCGTAPLHSQQHRRCQDERTSFTPTDVFATGNAQTSAKVGRIISTPTDSSDRIAFPSL